MIHNFYLISHSGFLRDNEIHCLSQVSKKSKAILHPCLLKLHACKKMLYVFEGYVKQGYLIDRMSKIPISSRLDQVRLLASFVFIKYCSKETIKTAIYDGIEKLGNIPSMLDFVRDNINIDQEKFISDYCNSWLPLNHILEGFSSAYNPIKEEDTVFAEALITMGANPDGIPSGRLTGYSLRECLRNDRLKHFHFLIGKGANPEIQNLNGSTILHFLASQPTSPIASIKFQENFQAVFQHYTNPYIKDKDGKTAMDIAKIPSYYDKGASIPVKVKLLEDYGISYKKRIAEIEALVLVQLKIEPLTKIVSEYI